MPNVVPKPPKPLTPPKPVPKVDVVAGAVVVVLGKEPKVEVVGAAGVVVGAPNPLNDANGLAAVVVVLVPNVLVEGAALFVPKLKPVVVGAAAGVVVLVPKPPKPDVGAPRVGAVVVVDGAADVAKPPKEGAAVVGAAVDVPKPLNDGAAGVVVLPPKENPEVFAPPAGVGLPNVNDDITLVIYQ